MSADFEFRHLLGGLQAGAVPFRNLDSIHRFALQAALADIIGYEAGVHGAPFDKVGFRNVLRKLAAGKAEVLFFPAAWDACAPHIVGATFNFRSLFMRRVGNDIDVRHGLYTEDVSLLLAKLRELIGDMPRGCKLPEAGLGKFFEEESLRYFTTQGLAGGVIPSGRRFEFLPKNTKIVRIQKELKADLGGDMDGLLRMEGLTPQMRERLKYRVPIEAFNVLMPDGTIDPENHILGWQNRNKATKVFMGFTNAISTFTGKELKQCQIVTAGDPLPPDELATVLSSGFDVAEAKARTDALRQVRMGQRKEVSSSIPLFGTAREIYEASFSMNAADIAARECSISNDDMKTVVPTHIHLQGEPAVLKVMKEDLCVGNRILGADGNVMQTGSIDLGEWVEEAGNSEAARSTRIVHSTRLLAAAA